MRKFWFGKKAICVFLKKQRLLNKSLKSDIMKIDKKKQLFKQIQMQGYWKEIPGRQKRVDNFAKDLFALLFPSCNTCVLNEGELELRYINFKRSLKEFYCPVGDDVCNENETFEENFMASLSEMYNLLIEDSKAIFNGDPAAISEAEIVHIYPGFYGIFIHRVAHVFYNFGSNILARILSEYAHSLTGIDIHPGAKIGKSFAIDHGTGIVIGETSEIGNNVRIYQGVTLGAKSVEKGLANSKRHPTIEDNVTIYSGASILGGDTVIGKNSTIGGNVFLTYSVDANSLVYQKNEVKVKLKVVQEELCC